MKRSPLPLCLSLALIAGLAFSSTPAQAAGSFPGAPQSQQVPSPQAQQPVNGGQGVSLSSAGPGKPSPVALLFDPNAKPNRVDAPALPAGGLGPLAANFVIDYVPAGSYNALGDACVAFPPQAVAPFQAAAAIWAGLINSPVTIRIEACWANLPQFVLGHSSPVNFFRDFTAAPVAGTWYPVALANSIHGSDLDPVPASKPASCTPTTCPDSNWDDISIAYANAYTSSFYYGTDGNDGGLTDFESVVLHEMTHGLGFAGSACVNGSTADWGCYFATDTYPTSYDRFTFNGSSAIIGFPHNSAGLLTALTSSNVSFNGAHAQAANGGAPVALYAPNPWQGGSSYSHLAEIFNGTPNALMTYAIGVNEVLHSPGPVTLGVLQDVGWTMSSGVVVAAPSGLAAAPLSPTQVQLSWTSNGAGETGYLVERSPNGASGWASIATPAAPASSYTDSSASEGTRYYYRVSETFPGPQSSAPSSAASAITPLVAPGGLAAVPASAAQINLTWTNNSAAATAYTVERSPNGSSGWVTLTTAAGLTGYSDASLTENTTAFYRVTATSALAQSAAVPAASSATTYLNAPTGLLAAPLLGGGQIRIQWRDASAFETGYQLQRASSAAGPWTDVTAALPAGSTSYVWAAANGTYYFQVRAVGSPANSLFSGPVSATLASNHLFVAMVR